MKFIFDLLAMFSLGRLVDLICDLVKARSLSYYVNAVEKLRLICLVGIATTLCILLFSMGFLLFHVALFLYVPWSDTTKMIVMLVLAGVYCIAPLCIIMRLHSRKQWLERTGATTLVEEVTRKNK